MNKIVFLISFRADDWTAERVIIASNVKYNNIWQFYSPTQGLNLTAQWEILFDFNAFQTSYWCVRKSDVREILLLSPFVETPLQSRGHSITRPLPIDLFSHSIGHMVRSQYL